VLTRVVDIGAQFAYNSSAPRGAISWKENSNGSQENHKKDQGPEESKEAQRNQTTGRLEPKPQRNAAAGAVKATGPTTTRSARDILRTRIEYLEGVSGGDGLRLET
jgi:hypothetical protein